MAPGPEFLKCKGGEYIECDSQFNEIGYDNTVHIWLDSGWRNRSWTSVSGEMGGKGVGEDGYYEWSIMNEVYKILDGYDIASAMGKTWDPNRQQILDARTGEYSDLFWGHRNT